MAGLARRLAPAITAFWTIGTRVKAVSISGRRGPHDPGGLTEDLVEMVERRLRLDLGDDRSAAAKPGLLALAVRTSSAVRTNDST
jgi:hypothetical protein